MDSQDGLKSLSSITPGPWEAERHGAVVATVDGRRLQVGAAIGQAPASGDPDIEPEDIQRANAQLMAAAPDLLEACERVRSLILGSLPDFRVRRRSRAQRAIEQLDTAISKAKGAR